MVFATVASSFVPRMERSLLIFSLAICCEFCGCVGDFLQGGRAIAADGFLWREIGKDFERKLRGSLT